ncbi:MAG: hypothetical protein JW795_11295 [Chitinivibrionales bacterium]|nr:hypothetical protein [Chitinivibrionales bacterium]
MVKRSLGVCFGASTVKIVQLLSENSSVRLERKAVQPHEGDPYGTLQHVRHQFGWESADFGLMTGRAWQKDTKELTITQPEAVEYGLRYLHSRREITKTYSAVVSLGAENFLVYILDRNGSIAAVEAKNRCASGTGEFFLQQIKRMNISLDQALALAESSEVYRVSGRCSVFCKSDCTHALNKGIRIGSVTAGLVQMIGEKVVELLEKVTGKEIIAIGGVTKNALVMKSVAGCVDELYIPAHADVFEALGAAYSAMVNEVRIVAGASVHIPAREARSFQSLPRLSCGESLVTFTPATVLESLPGDECIAGIDVGSTTTKAVLVRIHDRAIVASVYLRTNGNPIEAACNCYRSIAEQARDRVTVIGVAVTGSGRRIVGIHCQTDTVINEIIAHARGAAFFDSDVDTIFEIGGQDAKYIYLTHGVASDYAMNEACSAGTGSFLEEAALESFSIDFKDIAGYALHAASPLNFNDQCAAFISSDIKTAMHQGAGRDDILAGLVYSVCMNYLNRVKGQRRVGKKIFMQGGVCYNKAVPLAMANLIGTPIIVSPLPGLVGAFGVALELCSRLESGLATKRHYDLLKLANTTVEYGKRFICLGDTHQCDRKCSITVLLINGTKHYFGGACSKYYTAVSRKEGQDSVELDYVKYRQTQIFACDDALKNNLLKNSAVKHPTLQHRDHRKKIGVSRSFFTNTFFPLFYHFFQSLGFTVVLSDKVEKSGVAKARSSFCYPGEIAHGCFENLLNKPDLDYLFLPHITELYVENAKNRTREHQCTCLLLQAEAYWLRSAFKEKIKPGTVITALLDFSQGYASEEKKFEDIGTALSIQKSAARCAYREAVARQIALFGALKNRGKQLIADLEKKPENIAFVLFGRPYNAFAQEANLGIPTKLSRSFAVIPWDMLSFEHFPTDDTMCWAVGQDLLRAAQVVKNHPQLFGVFITNFSCGPDSFLVSYFRDCMKSKPSLTLELDSHTADAGVETRIEAFLDIVRQYRKLNIEDGKEQPFTPSRIQRSENHYFFATQSQKLLPLTHPKIRLLFPAMGRFLSEAMTTVFAGSGIEATVVPPYSPQTLKLGRLHSSCKECLPLHLTAGGLLDYLHNKRSADEYIVYFMPTCAGNCRFTQYSVFMNKLIKSLHIPNVALLTLTGENSYAGLPVSIQQDMLKAIIISDVFDDMYNALKVLALEPETAEAVFMEQWKTVCAHLAQNKNKDFLKLLNECVSTLAQLPLRYSLEEAKTVIVTGEIFVRRDHFCCQNIVEKLAQHDIIARRAPVFEWIRYVDYMVKDGVYEASLSIGGRVSFMAKRLVQKYMEFTIKKICSRSGLYRADMVDMQTILLYGQHFFNKKLTGEAIVVTGAFFEYILEHAHGMLSIGPFGCMPTRIIEAVLSKESVLENKLRLLNKEGLRKYSHLQDSVHELPFLSLEIDANPLPQIIEAKIEAFCLAVDRLYAKMQPSRNHCSEPAGRM